MQTSDENDIIVHDRSYYLPRELKQLASLKTIEGKTLLKFVTNIVIPEFNVASLICENSTYDICPLEGGELLGAWEVLWSPLLRSNQVLFPPFDCFLGRKILEVRMVGETWNGHGFELSFEGLRNKTMLIQAVEQRGLEPLHDALRLGIGNYWNSYSDI